LDGYTKEQVVMFEKLLNSQKKELLQDAEKTVHEMTDKEPQFADPADRASWESESIRDLRIRDRESKLLDKIEEALGRLADGTYGECDECGELISVGRLRARPVTTFCIDCKAAQEAEEIRPNHKRG
jgi:DnaK suppressor protein